ncbi:hypothetical protein N0V93_009881 [Gnomoniopsis smithogilvyi]|uniref:Uncharacterized protein n=1 Tax=Gnomoniopsis smithogilvyi TaxID=1191159 RepID=A0A9W8YHV2_9PEZI|nr:hypothetical protein N0V93_009881 [Gnomoniopsis smithogilvyi]
MESAVGAEFHGTIAQVRRRRLIRRLTHLLLGVSITGWWIAGLVLHHQDKNWIVPFLVWLAVISRLILWHVSSAHISRPLARFWNLLVRPSSVVPARWSLPVSFVVLVALIATAAFVAPEYEGDTYYSRGICLAGLALTMGILWLTSRHRRMVCWYTILVGLYLQFLAALFVLRTTVGYNIFSWLSDRAADLLEFADEGLAFLTDDTVPTLTWFLITVAPPIIFFAALAQLLSYWGALQWGVKKSAGFFYWALKVSGAEAVVAATSPFFGQGESVMLIKPFLCVLTKSELHQIMCSGFATIAGSVLVAYQKLGVSGTALISSCIMSIPASIVVSKLRYPEVEETTSSEKLSLASVEDARESAGNWMHSFTNGAWLGVRLAGIVVAVLACVIAGVDLCDAVLTWAGSYLNIEDLTLELIFGYLFVPIAFFLGIPNRELVLVGRLIAVKFLKNEFLAYEQLQYNYDYFRLTNRSRIISTYALCGFGNLGSLGTQVGLMTQMAPSRNKDIANVAFSAFLTGVVATITSASMVGMLLGSETAAAMIAASKLTAPGPPPGTPPPS